MQKGLIARLLTAWWLCIFCLSQQLLGQGAQSDVVQASTGNHTNSKFIITTRDEKLIKADAIYRITAFKDLLNGIALEDYAPEDLQLMIRDSYTVSSIQKFYDSTATITKDLGDQDNQKVASDEFVTEYLTDFNLYFEKDPNNDAVSFSNFRASHIKMGDHLYLKIFYDCKYNRKSLKSDHMLPLQKKVASFRIVKTGRGWKAFIEDVGNDKPEDDVDPNFNDISISPDPIVGSEHYQALYRSRNDFLSSMNNGRKVLPKGFDNIGQDSVYVFLVNYPLELGADQIQINISHPILVQKFSQDVWPDSNKLVNDFNRTAAGDANTNFAGNLTKVVGYFREKEEAESEMKSIAAKLEGLTATVSIINYSTQKTTPNKVNWNN
jgi:hypothetical protein